jgi:thioredoxin 1
MNQEKGIIYFSAPWCGPCKQLGPIMDSLASDGMNVKKVNCDYDANLVQQYNVRNIPTLVLTDRQGLELGRKVGMLNRQQILDFYNG